jgi:integrase
VQFTDENGKRRLKFASYYLSEAREIDAKYRYKFSLPKQTGIMFEVYLDNYFLPHFSKNKSSKHLHYMVERFRNAFSGMELDKIKPAVVEQAVLEFGRGKSSSQFNGYIAFIHRVFQYAIEIELIDKNPVKVKKSREDNTRRRFLNKDERTKLLTACQESKSASLYDMVYISLSTGMRLGEIQALKKEDVRDGCIYVSSSIAKSKQGRAIPMTKPLADFMSEATFDYNRHIKRAFNLAVKKAGLANVRFHDLRRTFGSMLAQAGVPVYDISKLLGYADMKLTIKVYAHLLPENLKSAVDKLAI